MKIILDRDICIGAASCVGIAPNVFALDDEDRVIVVDPNGADEDTIRMAAEMCPVSAIKIVKE